MHVSLNQTNGVFDDRCHRFEVGFREVVAEFGDRLLLIDVHDRRFVAEGAVEDQVADPAEHQLEHVFYLVAPEAAGLLHEIGEPVDVAAVGHPEDVEDHPAEPPEFLVLREVESFGVRSIRHPGDGGCERRLDLLPFDERGLDGLRRQRVEPEALAAGKDRWQQVVRPARCENEDGAGHRLLEGFQEGVGCLRIKLVGIRHDDDLVRALDRGEARFVDDLLADPIHGINRLLVGGFRRIAERRPPEVVDGGIRILRKQLQALSHVVFVRFFRLGEENPEVRMDHAVDLRARAARIAGLAAAALAEQRLRKRDGGGALTDPIRPAKEIGVRDASAGDRALQRLDGARLVDDSTPRHAA